MSSLAVLEQTTSTIHQNGIIQVRVFTSIRRKRQVGSYHSTLMWSFTMKSACCKHQIVIQTDPKDCEYVIISGAQKKTEDFDVEDVETFELPAEEAVD